MLRPSSSYHAEWEGEATCEVHVILSRGFEKEAAATYRASA